MGCALSWRMKAKKLEDLLIYQRALEGAALVSALLDRPAFGRNCDVRDQLSQSSGKIPGHIGEGFGQLTDKHFAHYLGIAHGSAQETRGHLTVARQKRCISKHEEIELSGLYEDLSAMLRAFIRHLRKSGFRDRWL
jgi:four helix bundle protein